MKIKTHNVNKDYNIISESGSGTYGSVYKAINKKTSKYVAVKFFNDNFLSTKHITFVNFREINYLIILSKSLRTNNVIDIYSIYSFNENDIPKLGIIMPYYDINLLYWISQSHKISEPRCSVMMMTIIKHIINGIHYIHSKGIIHRDLKPSNILISYKSGVIDINDSDIDIKIIDFGLSVFSGNIKRIYDAAGDVIHSLIYRAPEIQRKRDNFYHYSVDIWALGCIIADMNIKNEPLINAKNNMEYKNHIKNIGLTIDKKISNRFYNIILKKILIVRMRKRPNITEVAALFGLKLNCIYSENKKELLNMNKVVKVIHSELTKTGISIKSRLFLINRIVFTLVKFGYTNAEIIYNSINLCDRLLYYGEISNNTHNILIADICCFLSVGYLHDVEPNTKEWIKHISKDLINSMDKLLKEVYELIMVILSVERFEIYTLIPMYYEHKYEPETIFNILMIICDINYLHIKPITIFKLAKRIKKHGDKKKIIHNIINNIKDNFDGEFYMFNFLSDNYKQKYNII